MALEQRSHQNNLKHGLKESLEENMELSTFISNWLATLLKLEDSTAPIITNTYRVGPPSSAHLNYIISISLPEDKG